MASENAQIEDLLELLDRINQLEPLSEPFLDGARTALKNARDLSPRAIQGLRTAVLQAAAFESERLRQAATTRQNLSRLANRLGESSDQLRQAGASLAGLLDQLQELRKRLRLAAPSRLPDP